MMDSLLSGSVEMNGWLIPGNQLFITALLLITYRKRHGEIQNCAVGPASPHTFTLLLTQIQRGGSTVSY